MVTKKNLSEDDTSAKFITPALYQAGWASLECELIARRSWKNKTEARLAVFTWIESWYNPRRRHSGLNYQSPNNFERSHQQNHINAENQIIHELL